MHYAKIFKLLNFFEVTKLIELAERVRIVAKPIKRVGYRQSLLNRLNRAYDADPAEIVRKGTFQICRCRRISSSNGRKIIDRYLVFLDP